MRCWEKVSACDEYEEENLIDREDIYPLSYASLCGMDNKGGGELTFSRLPIGSLLGLVARCIETLIRALPHSAITEIFAHGFVRNHKSNSTTRYFASVINPIPRSICPNPSATTPVDLPLSGIIRSLQTHTFRPPLSRFPGSNFPLITVHPNGLVFEQDSPRRFARRGGSTIQGSACNQLVHKM